LKQSKIKFYLISVFFILFLAGTINAGVSDIATMELKTSFVQNYMWRGFDLLPDNDGAFQPDLYVELKNSGVYFGTWGSFGFDSMWDIWDEWDYYLGAFRSFNKESDWAVDMDFCYTYFDFPNQNRYTDTQEVAFGFKLPSLLAINEIKIKPFTTVYYSFPAHENEADQEGYWLKVGMDASMAVSGFNSENMNFLVESFLNDGGAGFQVDPGWSHIRAMYAIAFNIGGFKIKPSVNYQWSLEDTVNTEDEFWAEVSFSKTLF